MLGLFFLRWYLSFSLDLLKLFYYFQGALWFSKPVGREMMLHKSGTHFWESNS